VAVKTAHYPERTDHC